MPDYNGYFLKSNSSVVALELVEFSHPSFSQTFRYVRNQFGGVTVTLEDSTVAFFAYYPMKIDHGEQSDDLDSSLQVSFGDTGQTLPQELDRVQRDDSMLEYPTMIYRQYRSDDLSGPMEGPTRYQVDSLTPALEGATAQCSAPHLNTNATGEQYRYDRFPGLRAIQ